MPEAYLFSFASGEPAQALAQALSGAGARANWLDEVHWLGLPLPAAPGGKPLFAWPDAPLLPLFCLQAALRMLQSGAADLIALGQSATGEAAALLLGSPAAVGRWNLPPLARLEPLRAGAGSPEGFRAALQAALPHPPALAACSGFPSAGLGVENTPGEDIAGVCALAHRLAEGRAPDGLLAGFAGQGGLAIWIERV